ncbi:peptidase S41 [Antarcticibacterium arcticum]|uniref:Peptidase S41 n=1 Tax=Antarcticibacterium arcticum TaxID=2585771 RepID=A0A5B8YGG4_9FLAO|nr:S41 family peptidase [Antarcticibacterium arcticum]QED36681.1 peptidase S41 [Antarcticibacterium arcticum]
MKKRFRIFLIGFLIIGCKGDLSNEKKPQEKLTEHQEKVSNLKAFAKAYGYVKYFHPSDEAAKIDWNSFAAYGAGEILKCNNTEEVIATLNDLFKPVAPGVVFSNTKQAYDMAMITPDALDDYNPTYWQHKGVSLGMNNQGGVYNSVRVNRYTEIDESGSFGSLALFLDPEKYLGKEIKYTGWAKLKEGSKGTGHLWLRVDKAVKTMGFFENMDANPIKSNEWAQYEIEGTIDGLASGLVLGSFMKGKGTLFIDDVHLYYKENNEWVEIPIMNNDFEANTIGVKNEQSDWRGNSNGYSYSVSTSERKEGKQSAVIAYEGKIRKVKGTKLFDYFPKFGELIEKEIGDGIFAQIPLNLYGNAEITYPESTGFDSLQEKLNSVNESLDNQSVFLGNVINTYNVFQHFYPYFDEVDVDWEKELTTALHRSFNDQTEYDHLVTLQKFTAPLKDGHIHVNGPETREYIPPINWEWIEGKLVVTRVKDESSGIQVGDIVTKVNNQLPESYFKEINSRISAGTKGWLNYRAQHKSLLGEKGEQMVLEIKNKNITLNREHKYEYGYNDVAMQENDYKLLDENIYYLNLSKIEMDTITSLLPQLQQAKGIICDLRGYPNGNHGFISHLLKEKDDSKQWMRVPKTVYPDQEKSTGFEYFGWELQPRKPYLGDKKVVFIIDGRAISYAESYMSFIEGYELATIVGQPTAGTNGNINPFTLLGNFSISWTGMKVVKHDGSQLHAIGVLPDIYVNKSIVGFKEGRDEFLEKAMEVILN